MLKLVQDELTAASNTGRIDSAVTAFKALRISFEEANALRKQSKALPGDLGNSSLRHADEQTLTALAAVREAWTQYETLPDFDRWGVVCSSRYLGRSAFADSLTKFAAEGPWNVSVQVVPNRSLHSPASMIGLGLGCHGPCVGVGGGLDGETDAWLTAMTLLQEKKLPGILLVFTGWDADEKVDLEGRQLNQPQCTSLVLALQPSSVTNCAARLRLEMSQGAPFEVPIPAQATALTLFDRFASKRDSMALFSVMLGGGLKATMEWQPAQSIPLHDTESNPLRKAA